MWWALKSPSLFYELPSYPHTYLVQQGILGEDPQVYKSTLSKWDQDPSELHEFIGQGIKRLGIYFERLIACFVHFHPDFELVLQNHKVQEPKRTIGELDLVYKYLPENRLVHLEIAVKFYLGHGELEQWSNWYGPNPIDRLDLKMDKLLNKQSLMSQHPSLISLWSDLGFNQPESHILLKGCLYYPEEAYESGSSQPKFISTDHLQRPWKDVSSVERENTWYILPRLSWIGNVASIGDDYDLLRMQDGLQKPLQVVRFGERGGLVDRMFLVPHKWKRKISEGI
ncbi:MAG: DUF1853 family protein [Bacteroidota bacterium]